MPPSISAHGAAIFGTVATFLSELIQEGELLSRLSTTALFAVATVGFALIGVILWRKEQRRQEKFESDVKAERDRNHSELMTVITNNTLAMNNVCNVVKGCEHRRG
jgi:archaellum biogenesis protein FlaJ (TadC family)